LAHPLEANTTLRTSSNKVTMISKIEAAPGAARSVRGCQVGQFSLPGRVLGSEDQTREHFLGQPLIWIGQERPRVSGAVRELAAGEDG
jgi:hypothetical protein